MSGCLQIKSVKLPGTGTLTAKARQTCYMQYPILNLSSPRLQRWNAFRYWSCKSEKSMSMKHTTTSRENEGDFLLIACDAFREIDFLFFFFKDQNLVSRNFVRGVLIGFSSWNNINFHNPKGVLRTPGTPPPPWLRPCNYALLVMVRRAERLSISLPGIY